MSVSVLGTDPDKPNYCRPEYIAVAPDLKLIRDELGGTRAMHNASTEYIRKWRSEKKENYDIRRTCETFFEGFGRTLSAAVGMVFAKPIAVDWNRSDVLLKAHADNIDNLGTSLNVFVKRYFEAAVRDGFSVILVDHTPPPKDDLGRPRAPTAEEEAVLNLRPVWVRYDRSQIINWQTRVVANRVVLSLVVIHETYTEPFGPFGVTVVHKFRELRLENNVAVWRLWRLVREDSASDVSFKIEEEGVFTNKNGEPAHFIPIAVGYAGRTDAVMTAVPPLLGLAWANLSHWQLSTDLRFNTIVAAIAQPTVIGRLAEDPSTGLPRQLEIGPLVTVHLADGGDFRWTEPTGTGLERLVKLRDEKLAQISTLGMSFLMPDKRAAETAESKRLDSAAENATLATAAQGVEDGVNLALEYHAWYMGIDADSSPVVTFNRDYESTAMDAAIMSAYVRAVKDAGLPPRVLLEAWQRGGRIAEDVDLDELEMEMLANASAQEERERQERELQTAEMVENA